MSKNNNIWKIQNTEQMKRILATLEDARNFGYTNVIIGETGSGKTFITRKFADKNPDVYIVTIGQSDNIADVLDKILIRFDNESYQVSTKSRKIRRIIQLFREMYEANKRPMLIFDEAEYMKQPALCAMKELYDNLNGLCSIVMIGTEQLLANIEKMRRKNKEGIPQLYRRIKFGIRLLPAIDRTYKLFLDGIEDAGLSKFIRNNCDNYGELHDVLVPAMREAQRTGQPLTENFVRTILNMPTI